MDIEKAIEIEERYIENRLNGQEVTPLNASIQECGFDTLDDYFEAKRIYLISKAKLAEYRSSVSNAVPTLQKLIATRTPSILIVESDDYFVYHGSEEFNRTRCEELNIPVYEVQHMGGTIVGGAGDLSIGVIVPDYIDINSEWVLNGFCNIISKYINGAEVANNDILINGKKVLGSAIFQVNGMFALVAYISYGDRSEIISQICPPHKGKEPGYIVDLPRETFEDEVLQWLH